MGLRSFFQLVKRAVKGDVNHDFTQGSIGLAAFLLAVPMVLEMAMESIFAVVDMFYVSMLGVDAVAAVGLTEAVLTILYALAIGLSMGVTALVARRFGEGNNAAAGVIAAQALWVGAGVAVLVASLGILFSTDILRLMGASDAVLSTGEDYTLVMLCGSITILYLFLKWLPLEAVKKQTVQNTEPEVTETPSKWIYNQEHIQQMSAFDVGLLKGEAWEKQEHMAAIHRSCQLGKHEKRVLLTLDPM